MGPVDCLILEFPGNLFKGEIVPALAELTNDGTIHVIDLIFVQKEADGSVNWIEVENLPGEESAAFDNLDGDVLDLLNEDDIALAAESLEPNSSAALVVYENTWAIRLRDAIVNAGGRLVDRASIPGPIVDAAIAARQPGDV